MESNITKILIKKFWKRCVTLPLNSLQRGMTLPFYYSLSLMTLPSEAPALPPPPQEINLPSLKKIQTTKYKKWELTVWWKLNLNYCIKDILIYLSALFDLNVCFPGVIIGI